LSGVQLASRLAQSWLQPRMPSYLVYFVTAKCNAKCEMCFYWRETEAAAKIIELTPEETRKIAEHLPPLIQLTLSGGEPFMREDLFELVRPIIEKTRPPFLSIPSNGTMTERIADTVQRLATSFPQMRLNVELSVEGIGEEHDRALSRLGAFESLRKTWGELKKIQPGLPNLRLGVLTVLSGLNQDTILGTLQYIKRELKPDRLEVLFARGEPRNPDAARVSIDKFRKVSAWLEKEMPLPAAFMDRLRRELGREKRDLIISTVSQDRLVTPCLAGKKLVVIEPDGMVRPCEVLTIQESQISDLRSQPDKISGYWLGSLREAGYDLRKIMASEQAGEILDFIDRSSCHCSYECAALAGLVFSPGSMLKILRKTLSAQ